ncbi:MAG: sensor domain-containing diguanylate cyclase [Burkholderiaceae bacterium]
MNDPTHPTDPNTAAADLRAARRSALAWALLALVAAAAVTLVLLSVTLHAHARSRGEVVRQLTALEVKAADQNTLVWRAMTQLMAGDTHPFIRTRGTEQRHRQGILADLARLMALERDGDLWNARLGFAPAPELLDGLARGTERFLSAVQSAFGLMKLTREQLRERLGHWDMNHGEFASALEAVRTRDEMIAMTSARIANRVTALAALISLAAALLFVARLARARARRLHDLQQTRLRMLAASESRLRALVEHSTDLIMVITPQGAVRFATPSATRLNRGHGGGSGAGAPELTLEGITGLDVDTLLSRERNEIAVHDIEGRRRVFEIRANDLRGDPAIAGIVLNGRDITETKALENELRHQALHDPLTGLPNRRCFVARFDALDDAERRSRCVLFVDLDGFKLVNDSYGHVVGDQLLIHTAARIGTCLGQGDLLARQGGDEFIVLGDDAATAAHPVGAGCTVRDRSRHRPRCSR